MSQRDINSAEWKAMDEFFDFLYEAHKNGKITKDQFRTWITHYIGNTHYENIDTAIAGMNNLKKELQDNDFKFNCFH